MGMIENSMLNFSNREFDRAMGNFEVLVCPFCGSPKHKFKKDKSSGEEYWHCLQCHKNFTEEDCDEFKEDS